MTNKTYEPNPGYVQHLEISKRLVNGDRKPIFNYSPISVENYAAAQAFIDVNSFSGKLRKDLEKLYQVKGTDFLEIK